MHELQFGILVSYRVEGYIVKKFIILKVRLINGYPKL